MSHDKHLRCSFCGKSKDSVRKFISGPSVYICNECIALCNEILAKEILYTRAQVNRLLAKHTGRAVEQIERDFDRDNYMSAEEAKAYGIIDHVIERRGELVDVPSPAAHVLASADSSW